MWDYVKDLSRLGRDLARVVIVDDNPLMFMYQPDNALHIGAYEASMAGGADNVLPRVAEVLLNQVNQDLMCGRQSFDTCVVVACGIIMACLVATKPSASRRLRAVIGMMSLGPSTWALRLRRRRCLDFGFANNFRLLVIGNRCRVRVGQFTGIAHEKPCCC